MATSTGTRPTTTTNDGARHFDRRLSTETKGSSEDDRVHRLAVLAGLLIAGLVIEDDGGQDFFAADKVWLYATILTVGYMISRGLAKSGSRDPYWSGGTNQNRDD